LSANEPRCPIGAERENACFRSNGAVLCSVSYLGDSVAAVDDAVHVYVEEERVGRGEGCRVEVRPCGGLGQTVQVLGKGL
jgi:hypothetical protein